MPLTSAVKKYNQKKTIIKNRTTNKVIDALQLLPVDNGCVRFTTKYLGTYVKLNTQNWNKKSRKIRKAVLMLERLGRIEILEHQTVHYMDDYSVLITPFKVRLLNTDYVSQEEY